MRKKKSKNVENWLLIREILSVVKSHKFKRLSGAVWQLICVSGYGEKVSFRLSLFFLILLCKDN